MSEEERGEQDLSAQEENVPEPQEQDTETPSEPEQSADEGRLGELSKELESLKGVLGRQGEELGQLRNENAYWRSQQQGGQQQGFQQSQQYPQQPAGSTVDDYDWTDPKSVQRMIDSRVSQVEQKLVMQQQQAAFHRGKSVMERDKDTFKGIEQQVAQMMVALAPNMPPMALEDPNNWYMVADALQGRQRRIGGQKANVNPVAPTQTETPSSVRQREPDKGGKVHLDEAGRKLAKAFGLDNEGVNSIVEEERKERDWRNS